MRGSRITSFHSNLISTFQSQNFSIQSAGNKACLPGSVPKAWKEQNCREKANIQTCVFSNVYRLLHFNLKISLLKKKNNENSIFINNVYFAKFHNSGSPPGYTSCLPWPLLLQFMEWNEVCWTYSMCIKTFIRIVLSPVFWKC